MKKLILSVIAIGLLSVSVNADDIATIKVGVGAKNANTFKTVENNFLYLGDNINVEVASELRMFDKGMSEGSVKVGSFHDFNYVRIGSAVGGEVVQYTDNQVLNFNTKHVAFVDAYASALIFEGLAAKSDIKLSEAGLSTSVAVSHNIVENLSLYVKVKYTKLFDTTDVASFDSTQKEMSTGLSYSF